MKFLPLMSIVVFLVACGPPRDETQATPTAHKTTQADLDHAIRQLSSMPPYHFIIIRSDKPKRFVQIGHEPKRQLLMDVPLRQMSAEESARAQHFFIQQGFKLTKEMHRDHNTGVETSAPSYQRFYSGQDIDRLVTTALKTFTTVYGASPIESARLSITRSWEEEAAK